MQPLDEGAEEAKKTQEGRGRAVQIAMRYVHLPPPSTWCTDFFLLSPPPNSFLACSEMEEPSPSSNRTDFCLGRFSAMVSMMLPIRSAAAFSECSGILDDPAPLNPQNHETRACAYRLDAESVSDSVG